VIFNGLARTYDKYIYEDGKLKKSMDYVSVKILLGGLLIFINVFIHSLYKLEFGALLLLISFIV
jgi:hypothetical protein